MFSSSLPHCLARPVFQTTRFSSAVATVASGVARYDLALEKRRAARLAREALLQNRSETAALGVARDRTYAVRRPNPTSAMAYTTPMRPRRPTGGAQRSRGTERSRMQATIINPAASTIDSATRGASKRAETAKTQASQESQEEDISPDLPKFMSPEFVTHNLASVLNKVPCLAPPLPSLPPAHEKLSPGFLKCTYAGDYSKYQLDTQEYLRGARGVGPAYARIILGRNGTFSQNSRKKLHRFIEKGTRGPRKPISMA